MGGGILLGALSCDSDAVIFCIASLGDTGAAYDLGLKRRRGDVSQVSRCSAALGSRIIAHLMCRHESHFVPHGLSFVSMKPLTFYSGPLTKAKYPRGRSNLKVYFFARGRKFDSTFVRIQFIA